jgi:predicted Zn-dependent protease
MTTNPAELAERALASATGPCLVLVDVSSAVNVRWAANTLTTNGQTGGYDVTVVSVHGGDRAGAVSRSGVQVADLPGLVAEAEASARAASPAEDAADLITAESVTAEVITGAADFDDPAGEVTAGDLTRLAERLGAAFDSARRNGTELFGYAEQTLQTTYLASSTGVRARHAQPVGTVQVNGKSAGRSRSAWAGSAGRTLDEIDVAALDAEVTERLGWQSRQVQVPAGRHDAVLPPSAVADLMTYALWSADARSAHEGRSAFGRPAGGTRVGDQLSSLPLTLSSDPGLPGFEVSPVVMTGSSHPMASVFDNGMPVGRTAWIDGGRLAALPTTRHSARLAGLSDTPCADNLQLVVDGAAGSTMDLVGDLDDGLLLTCLWYIREVDPQTLLLTGLTRDGVYKVEGGQVVGAVTNYRFNESPVDLLDRIAVAGASAPTLGREFGEYFPRVVMPPLTVEGFNFSSVSQAS